MGLPFDFMPVSPEQALDFNHHYDLTIIVGAHGSVGKNLTPETIPTQAEYAQAAALVDTFRRDDVLFVEQYGYEKFAVGPELTALGRAACVGYEQDSDSTALASIVTRVRQTVEADRTRYGLDIWSYAGTLAMLKGVPVFSADRDGLERAEDVKANGGVDIIEYVRSNPSTDLTTFNRCNGARETRAGKVIVGWGVHNLETRKTGLPSANPEPGTASSSEVQKQRLFLLYGRQHEEGLIDTFGSLRVNFRVTHLLQASRQARHREYLSYRLGLSQPTFQPHEA